MNYTTGTSNTTSLTLNVTNMQNGDNDEPPAGAACILPYEPVLPLGAAQAAYAL